MTHLIFLECVNFGSIILSYVLFVHSFLNRALPQPFHSLYHTSLWCDMTQTALTSRVRSWYSFIIASSETSLGIFFFFRNTDDSKTFIVDRNACFYKETYFLKKLFWRLTLPLGLALKTSINWLKPHFASKHGHRY